jgi:hypothetical protein|tara:strand:- start:7 stop:474 length:468 start_codon:yes stop_codon:yes gene_type:complete
MVINTPIKNLETLDTIEKKLCFVLPTDIGKLSMHIGNQKLNHMNMLLELTRRVNRMKENWEDNPFHDDMLYVVDGELLNHLIRVLNAFKNSPDLPETYNKVLTYILKSVIQCVNYPTGEVVDSEFDIEFEELLWQSGIRLPNPEDPNNQYPEEDL